VRAWVRPVVALPGTARPRWLLRPAMPARTPCSRHRARLGMRKTFAALLSSYLRRSTALSASCFSKKRFGNFWVKLSLARLWRPAASNMNVKVKENFSDAKV
jgi:hypothetical protein